jgi:putative lipoic acid-binding regulatory protein
MILDSNSEEKPKIEYPCEWGYKVIGKDKDKLKVCIFEVMGERDYEAKDGNSSSKGTFHTMNARCHVLSEEERDAIFKAFQEHDAVKMVI